MSTIAQPTNNNSCSETDTADFDSSTETTALMDAHIAESHTRQGMDPAARRHRPKRSTTTVYGVHKLIYNK